MVLRGVKELDNHATVSHYLTYRHSLDIVGIHCARPVLRVSFLSNNS